MVTNYLLVVMGRETLDANQVDHTASVVYAPARHVDRHKTNMK